MARYFFDLSEGERKLPDELGFICASDQNAIKYAWKALTECIADPTVILSWQHAEIDVRREDGVCVARVAFTMEVETLNPATATALERKPGTGSPASMWDLTRDVQR